MNDIFFLFSMSILGLLIGKIMNIAIFRLPIMIERSLSSADYVADSRLNWVSTVSNCPICQHSNSWYENLPLISFIKFWINCKVCGVRLSWRYPLVELATAVLFVWSAWTHVGWGPALAWAGFSSVVLTLAVIDAETMWLPDALTQPLIWGGLITAAMGWNCIALADALAGAVFGYLSLWSVYWFFLMTTGKEGMGYGDFKMLAALGAWFGWQSLLALVLIASISSLMTVAILQLRRRLPASRQIPFGPFLAIAAAWLMFFGMPKALVL